MKKILCLALVLVSLIGIFVLSSCKNKDNLLLEISDIVGIENENIDNQNRKVSFAVNEDCTEFDFGNISFSLSEEITYKVYADFELTVEIQGNAVLSDGENLFYVAVWHNDNEDKKITYVFSINKSAQHVHSFGEWTVVTEATCTEAGLKKRTCEVCGEQESEVIEAKGHDYDEGKVATEATCTEDGVKTYTCQRDGCGYSCTKVIPKAHIFEKWETIPATCSKPGKEYRECEICSFREETEIPATGIHIFKNDDDSGTCAECGVAFGVLGYAWDDEKRTCTIIGVNVDKVADNSIIRIEETFSIKDIEYTVTAIAENAFQDLQNKPYSVQVEAKELEIGGNAFCGEITSITFAEGSNITAKGDIFGEGENDSLISATIPVSLAGQLSDCKSLQELTLLKDKSSTISSNSFEGFSYLKKVTIGNGITNIESNAFNGCSFLSEVALPDSLKNIGESAFAGCEKLKTISLPAGILAITGNAFEGCALTTASAPITDAAIEALKSNSVTMKTITLICGNIIPESAFQGFSALTGITIPSSVTIIGEGAFNGCSALESITIPENVEEIEASAFSGCSALTSITIPSSVTKIGANAFKECESLESVVFNKGSALTRIIGFTFEGCTRLQSIIIPQGVQYIGESAFSGCSALESITIPDSVDEIGANAFSGCGALTSITIPSSVTNIGVNAFSDCPIETAEIPTVAIKALPKDSLTSVTITSGSSITDNAFEGFTKLTSITIPLSVTTIGYSAFSGCSALTEITIPSRVTYIGASAFSGCSALESITIPDSVDEIGANAFSGCTNLVIYAEAASKPGSWSDEWNSNNLPVVWGYATSNEKIELSGFLWGLTGEQASLIKYLGSNEKIIIERTVEFLDKTYTVSKIKGNAFDGSVPLSAVTIPSSVCVIEANAFENYDNLIIYTSEIAKPKFWDSAWKNDAISVVWGNGTSDETIEHHGFKWKFDKDNLQAWIIAYLGQSDTLVLEDTVHFLNNTYTVYKISENAFAGSVSLKSIIIPGTVAVIENSAFSGCPNLTIYAVATEKPEQWMNGWKNDNTIVVWDCNGQKYFAYNGFDFSIDNLDRLILQEYTGVETEVNIPEKVTLSGNYYSVSTIAANAFKGKSNITKVTIPFSVDTIGFAAFEGCDNLQTLTIYSSSLTFVKDNGENAPAFANQETQDNDKANMGYLFGIEHHDNNAAFVPDRLETIELPNMNEIHSFLFYNFVHLQSVVLSEKLESIGDLAFRGTGIEAIDLNNCTNIGAYAFYKCENLQTVKSTASEISVGEYAFTHCVNLNSELVNSLLSKMDKVTNNVFYDTGVKSLVIPEQFSAQTETPNRPFGESSPTSVTLPANKFGWLDYINKSQIRTIVFTGETGLSLTANMFAGFTALEKILLPSNTTGFSEDVFPSVKDAGRRYDIYCSFGKEEGLTDNWNKEHRVIWNYKNAGYIDDMHYLVNDVKEQAVLIGVFDGSMDDKTIIPDDATLRYNNKNYTITISQNVFDYSGATVSYDENHIGYVGNWAVGIEDGHENSVKQIVFKEGTVGIIDYAFTSCTGLETIKFEQDIIIGDYAFYGCSSLSSVTIAKEKEVTFVGEWAFTHCENLTEVNRLIENLKIIPDHAFYNTGITTLTISAEIVDTSAFAYCGSLESIVFNKDVQINDYAFEGCSNLRNITIAEGKKITAIGEGAFSECVNLSEIDELIKDVEIIPVKAFYKTGVKQITVSSATTSIESEAFSECNSLTIIMFELRQETTISVKEKSFANCIQLEEVQYSNSLNQIELCEN